MGKALRASKEVKDIHAKFEKNMESTMDYRSLFQSDFLVFDWVDEMEFACPYIDIIVRNPKLTLIQEKNVVKVERAKRVNVESVKNLAKNTHYINKVHEDRSVEPKKILEVRNEETFNIYEDTKDTFFCLFVIRLKLSQSYNHTEHLTGMCSLFRVK